jgi:LysR family transcriptional regulator, low CO2-responsive transcriptional regulator
VAAAADEQLGKRLHLTAASRALVKSAQSMTDEWLVFEQTVSALKGMTQGRLQVSAVSTAKYFVPAMLGTFVSITPQSTLRCRC